MEQEELQRLVKSLIHEPIADGEYLILRLESKREWGMRLSNGHFERVFTGWDCGMGVQAFTPTGVTGFAAADNIEFEIGQELIKRARTLAVRNEKVGAQGNREIWQAPKLQAELPNPAKHRFDEVPLHKLQEFLMRIHTSLQEAKPDVAWQTSYRQIEDFWCIGRSDGTLVSFVVPRAVLMHQGTVRSGGRAQNSLVHRAGTDVGIILAELEDRALEAKACDRADFALQVCQAPYLNSGHYPLIIDYGLAKGLAHEAFGHAVESDHMQESVLGEKGKLRRGLQVARPGVHILDGPLEGDWAYQPYSANGLRRETVSIVRDGVLENGLGDIFSAAEAGMPVTGAGRAESYNHIPLPRMSNIRLSVDNMIPLETSPKLGEEIIKLRAALQAYQQLPQKEGEKMLLLLGYRGGQVNPKTGDFVFQCDGIVDIADPNLKVYQPSIFSGKILSALKAIRAGLGEGCFNAIGTCGKAGQAVPSSGGSHRYLILDADAQVSLGGERS